MSVSLYIEFNPQFFDNHRDISFLLSIAGNILATILLNRLNINLEQKYHRKSMCIQKRQWDNRHDLHSKTASGEMPRTECRSVQ